MLVVFVTSQINNLIRCSVNRPKGAHEYLINYYYYYE